MRTLLTAVLILTALAPAAPAAAPAAAHTVSASNFAWTPTSLTVAPGDTVQFVNGGGSHTWVSDAGMGSCALPCTQTFTGEGAFPYHCGIHPSMTGTVQVGAPPTVSIEAPSEGATVEGIILVSGVASHPSSGIASVELAVDGGSFSPAAVDEGGAWQAQLDTRAFTNGAHQLVARATAENGMSAHATRGVLLDNVGFVDLRVTSVTPINGYPDAKVHFAVRNDGNVATGPWSAAVEYAYKGEWHPVGSVSFGSTAPGASATAIVTWSAGGFLVGGFEVRVIADAGDALAESDEDDNVRGARVAFLTGSVDGVDARDP